MKIWRTSIPFAAAVIAAIGCMAMAAPASAGPFRVRTSRPAYPDTEVARPLTLEKEWAEYALVYQFREVTEFTDLDGKVEDASYEYRHSWLNAEIRYGFTKNMTIYMTLPFSVLSEQKGGDPTDNRVTESGMGDVRFGFTWQALKREKDRMMTSVALNFDTKQPSGNESPGVPGNRHLLLGTGTTNAGMKLLAKQRIGPIAATANLGYTHKFSGVTMYTRDTEANGLNGRFKPGDEIGAGFHLIAQPITLVGVDLGADYVLRGNAAVGHTASGINPGADLKTIPDSGFEALNASAKLFVEPSVNWDFVIGASVPVMSKNSQAFYPLEDLSQSYGTTITTAVLFRW